MALFQNFIEAAIAGCVFIFSIIILGRTCSNELVCLKIDWKNRVTSGLFLAVIVLCVMSAFFNFSIFLLPLSSIAMFAAMLKVNLKDSLLGIDKMKGIPVYYFSSLVNLSCICAMLMALPLLETVQALALETPFSAVLSAVILLCVSLITVVIVTSGSAVLPFYGEKAKKIEEVLLANKEQDYACGTSQDTGCKSIFNRLTEYLETQQAYLDPNLLASDVVNRIYTNRSYLAKAIKLSNAGNFNKLVNSYRIKYAIKLFEKDPSLTLSQLAYMSGFRTVSTFSASFRMETGESPVEWCKYKRATFKK